MTYIIADRVYLWSTRAHGWLLFGSITLASDLQQFCQWSFSLVSIELSIYTGWCSSWWFRVPFC